MVVSNNIGFDLLEQAQSQKEVTANAALVLIDAIMNRGVIDRDLTAPPGGESEGDLYIPLATATGDWAGNEGKIAIFLDAAWSFIIPNEGMRVWVNDEDKLIVYDGSAWVSTLVNVTMLGVNATADATNKLSVASSAILFNNIGNSMQVKVNKAAAGDTASFLFQTNFSSFAEFGLVGDDDFVLKVSPDNFSTNYDAFIVDKDTGEMAIKETATFEKNIAVTGFLRLPVATQLIIDSGSGAVTAVSSHHKIDTYNFTATDDLDTINGGTEGDILVIESKDSVRTVVVKHNVGNILLFGKADISLYDYGLAITLFYDGTNWIQM